MDTHVVEIINNRPWIATNATPSGEENDDVPILFKCQIDNNKKTFHILLTDLDKVFYEQVASRKWSARVSSSSADDLPKLIQDTLDISSASLELSPYNAILNMEIDQVTYTFDLELLQQNTIIRDQLIFPLMGIIMSGGSHQSLDTLAKSSKLNPQRFFSNFFSSKQGGNSNNNNKKSIQRWNGIVNGQNESELPQLIPGTPSAKKPATTPVPVTPGPKKRPIEKGKEKEQGQEDEEQGQGQEVDLDKTPTPQNQHYTLPQVEQSSPLKPSTETSRNKRPLSDSSTDDDDENDNIVHRTGKKEQEPETRTRTRTEQVQEPESQPAQTKAKAQEPINESTNNESSSQQKESQSSTDDNLAFRKAALQKLRSPTKDNTDQDNSKASFFNYKKPNKTRKRF